MYKALAPRKDQDISVLGKRKYGLSSKRSNFSSSRSILGMVKFNQDSGVIREKERFDYDKRK